MAESHHAGSKLFQAAVYVLTSISMAYTVYTHVTFGVEGGIRSVGVDDLQEAWITVLLIPAILALLICAFVSLRLPRIAARLAIILCIPAWAYYALFFAIFSLTLFLTLEGFMWVVLPMVLLGLTTFYSFRVMRWSAR